MKKGQKKRRNGAPVFAQTKEDRIIAAPQRSRAQQKLDAARAAWRAAIARTAKSRAELDARGAGADMSDLDHLPLIEFGPKNIPAASADLSVVQAMEIVEHDDENAAPLPEEYSRPPMAPPVIEEVSVSQALYDQVKYVTMRARRRSGYGPSLDEVFERAIVAMLDRLEADQHRDREAVEERPAVINTRVVKLERPLCVHNLPWNACITCSVITVRECDIRDTVDVMEVVAPKKLSDVREVHIQRVINSTGGNLSEAARILGVSRTMLKRRRVSGSRPYRCTKCQGVGHRATSSRCPQFKRVTAAPSALSGASPAP